MFPITPADNARPFETIAMDFITKLPQSGGFDTILMIMDTDCSKASIFIPCHKAINSEGVALLYLNHVIPHYGTPRKIISDHNTRFVLKFSTELCQLLNIYQNISMAYHPQTDRSSERTNQTLEQYLQIFCGTQQDNWHAWLPLVQYTKNSWPSATTKKAPYDLLIRYTPQIHQPTRKTTMPSLEQRLLLIEEARKAAQEAQRKAQESWIKEKPHHSPFPIGSKVWLEGTNLRLPSNITPKLSPRRYRPFKVVSQVSKVAYHLKLPTFWKIHDVFHASLLTPYKETEQHGPNFLEPLPEILDGEPEWEVEKVLRERSFGHWKKKQYLVCWKGYSPAHDSWVNSKDFHTPELLADFQRTLSSIRTLQLDNSSPSCPLPAFGHSSIATLQSSLPSNTTSSNQELEFMSPTPTLLSTCISAKNSTAFTIDRCPLTLSPPSIPLTLTNTTRPSSTPNNQSMQPTTSPFSPRSPTPEGPTSIVGQLGTLRVTNMSSEVSLPTSTTPEEQRSSPPPFPSPLLASRSSSPSLPHPYTLPLPIPPPSSPQNPANMAPEQFPSPMTTALEILAATASTFTQIPPTPPVSLQHPSLLYPFKEHSCRFDQTHPTSEDIKEVRKRCRALLKVMEQQERVTGALSAWTEDLMGAINILGNDGLDDESFETTYHDFKAVQHLFFVPCILDLTEPYMDDDSVNSDEPICFAQYQPTITRSTSPSESIRLAPPLTSDLQDPDHPGEG